MERILACLREAEALAAALDDPRRLGQVLVFLTAHFHIMGAYDQAITVAQRALALATAGGDVVLCASEPLPRRSLPVSGGLSPDGRLPRASRDFFDGARQRERVGPVFLPAVTSRAYLAWCHAELGTFAEGMAIEEEGLRIAEAVAQPGNLMHAPHGTGMLALRKGDLPRALPYSNGPWASARTRTSRSISPGWLRLWGRHTPCPGASPTPCRCSRRRWSRALQETLAYQVLCRLPLAEAQLLAGRLAEAHALAERALALARAYQERGHQAYALHLLGDIAAQRNPPERKHAEAHYQQALALAEELGMHPLQAHCHFGLGTLYAKTGEQEQARAELNAAIEMYRTMDMTFWLLQAEAALVQVEGP